MNRTLEDVGIASILSIGEVAKRSGTTVPTLHFYESKGLIHSNRSEGNQRRYGRDVLRRIAFIRVAQRVGISLSDIGFALDSLPKNQTPVRADWERLSRSWQDQLDVRIAQLQKLRDTLDDCIGCGCLSIDRCKLRNPLDRCAQIGSGPRHLWIGTDA